jgi:RNA polymerase sigma-70 factor (ECF subfamily)
VVELSTFAEVVRTHQAMVFSIAYHFLRDRFAAEEVAQDVFLQLHAKLGALESPDHVKFWLRRTASHRSIDYARKRRPGTVSLDAGPELSVDGDPGDPLLRERLRVLIASLPETPRMAMILRYQEELMPEEIARVMEMPVRTVKSHLHRSLAMLREKIERSMGEVT